MKPRLLLLISLRLAMAVPLAWATVNDALSFAKEAAAPYAKQGYTIREDAWGGDLGVKDQQAVTAQLFKGNEYGFWLATDTRGAVITVHIYDSDGKLAETEFWQKGRFRRGKDHAQQRQAPITPLSRWKNRLRSARIGRSSMATGNLETLTLEFENARAVQALYGGDDKLLRELEAALDVRVTSREGWLRIEGAEDGVSRARKVFEQLNEARKRGVVIRRPGIQLRRACGWQERRRAIWGVFWICGFKPPLANPRSSQRPMARNPTSWPCRLATSPSESALPEQERPTSRWRPRSRL